MSFEQGLIMLLIGAILGSGGAILAGKSVMNKKGISDEDLAELLEKLNTKKKRKDRAE